MAAAAWPRMELKRACVICEPAATARGTAATVYNIHVHMLSDTDRQKSADLDAD